MTMFWMSMSNLTSSWTRRSVSYMDRNSGMQTATKVVWEWSLNCLLTLSTTCLNSSSFEVICVILSELFSS